MSAAIVISSSPPLLWAREPTPVLFSPPGSQNKSRPSESTGSPRRFKTSSVARDGFSPGFNSPRALSIKPGVENIPLHSVPPKDRFKTTLSSPKRRSPPFVGNRSPSDALLPEPIVGSSVRGTALERPSSRTELAQEAEGQRTPHRTEAVVPRKTDWTPVADDHEIQDIHNSVASAWGENARGGLMDNFGFKSTKIGSNVVTHVASAQDIVKRRKLDLVEVAGPIIQKAEKRKTRSAVPTKVKAAAKKAKTITDLVTSHHRGEKLNESELAEYLVATQSRMVTGSACDDVIVATTSHRRPTAPKRGRGQKPKLLSPTSAIKAVEHQQPMFGSLSQLARDEPMFEADLSSDLTSPVRTQPISIESTTPRLERGISRYVRTRNLWGAAERDENNALVFAETAAFVEKHVAGVDLAGQDAFVNPGRDFSATKSRQHDAATMSSRTFAPSPSRTYHTSAVVDVDDLPSPANANVIRTEVGQLPMQDAVAGIALSPSPPRPRYAGMHTDDLKKAIQGYGFKPIKSRQKMIEKLEQCWDQEKARTTAKATKMDAATENVVMKQSDFISDVHDLSARAVLKSKKPKVKKVDRRNRAGAASMDGKEGNEATLAPPQEPKKRKRAAIDAAAQPETDEIPPQPKPKKRVTTKNGDGDQPEAPKKARGRPKKATLPESAVQDVDDIDDDFTNLTTIREEREKQKARLKAIEAELLTPPVTLHVVKNTSKPLARAGLECSDADEALEPEIGRQIYAAILHQSKEAAQEQGRDHTRNPSWHEKILMYDPIILEDLARWLNAEGLSKIKEDREVTALDVRSWCESKGICCLWKGGWRGQVSTKSSD